MSEREILDWAGVGPAARRLAETIHADGFAPDVILAIARGGLIVAASLAYALGVKNILGPDDAKVLVADDVADTGATLELVKGFCGPRVGEVRVATLYEKPRSIVKCEDVWRRTDRWIEFPWSARPALTAGAVVEA